MDSAEDWDNEEYTGSLADTKVFTPSTSITEPASSTEESKTQDRQTVQSNQNVNLSLLQQEVCNIILYTNFINYIIYKFFFFLYIYKELPKLSEIPPIQQQTLMQQTQQQQPILSLPAMQLSQQPNAISGGVLTAAQTQYLTQLTQQTSENLKAAGQNTFSSSISNQVIK